MNQNNRLRMALTVAMLTGAMSAVAEEWNFRFQPRVSIGWGDYSLESGKFQLDYLDDSGNIIDSEEGKLALDLDPGNPNSHTIKINAPMAGIGAGLGYGPFYVDVYYQKLFSDENGGNCYTTDYGPDEPVVSAGCTEPIPEYGIRDDYSPTKGDRDELNFSIGYGINEAWSVFAGYRKGEMNWDQKRHTTSGEWLENDPIYGPLYYDSTITRDGEFKLDGYYLGTTYQVLINEGEHGALLFKVAVGKLDGDLKVKGRWISHYPDPGLELGYFKTTLSGSADTYSIGAYYNNFFPQSEHWAYSVGVDYQYFDFDMDGDRTTGENNINIRYNDGSFTETLLSLRLNINYVF